MNTNTILVIGSTGKTGKRVATRLTDRGIDVRHGSRSSATPFDWEKPSTWAPALDGVTAVYVTYSPDLAVPGSVEAITELVALAVAAGVRRLVLLSGRGEEEAERAEDVVRASGAEWTIVRATWFAQNFSEGNFADDVAAGVVALPVGDVLEPFVDADDIADVAVAALTEDRHVGQTYELTGPRLLTFADAVSEIARPRAGSSGSSRCPWTTTPPRLRNTKCHRMSSRYWGICSPPCWTGGTPHWPTECNARSDTSRETSPTSPARLPRPACGPASTRAQALA